MRHQPYLNVFGAVTHSDKTDGVFDINVTQYESHYKTNRTLSVLPVRAEFNLNKYKTKKPIPSDNTYVAFEGFLADIDTDTTGHAFLFHIEVDNVNFLGKAPISATCTSGHGRSCACFTPSSLLNNSFPKGSKPNPSSCFKYKFDVAGTAASVLSEADTLLTVASSGSPSQSTKRV
jgi:hypothetical protein